jgi:SWI/SNF-related matrix-associated actin-dependent regulator 1 of chromatin subfamily A
MAGRAVSALAAVLLALVSVALASSAPAPGSQSAGTLLPDWLRARGALVEPVTVGSPRASYFDAPHTTFARPGVWAAADIPAGAVIADIPASLLLFFNSTFAPDAAPTAPAWSARADSPAAHMAALLNSLQATNLTDPYALLAARLVFERTRDTLADQSALFAPFSALAGLAPVSSGRVALSSADLSALHLSSSSQQSSPLPSVAAEHADLTQRMAAVLRSLVTPDLSNEVLASLRASQQNKHSPHADATDPAFAAAAAAAAAGVDTIDATPYAHALPHTAAALSPEAFMPAYAQTLASALALPAALFQGEAAVALVPLVSQMNHRTALARPLAPPRLADATTAELGLKPSPTEAAAAAELGPSAVLRLSRAPAGGRWLGGYSLQVIARRPLPAGAQVTIDYGQLLTTALATGAGADTDAAAVAAAAADAEAEAAEAAAAAAVAAGEISTAEAAVQLSSIVAARSARAAAAKAAAAAAAAASPELVARALTLPPAATPNAVLLLHFGAALPANPVEGVLLQAQVAAPEASAASTAGAAPAPGSGASAASDAAAAVQRETLLRRLLTLNKLPDSASVSLAAPLRGPANAGFYQALRAAQLSARELGDLDANLGLRFDPARGYFSLHNELATALGVFEAMDAIMRSAGASVEDDETEWGLAVKKTARAAAEAAQLRSVALKAATVTATPSSAAAVAAAATALAAAESALGDRVWEAQRVAYRLATARAVRAAALGALGAVADVFTDLSPRWGRDAAAVAAETGAGPEVAAAAKRWLAELEGWRADVRGWAAEFEGWGQELVTVKSPLTGK